MREVQSSDLRFQLVTADECVMRVDAGLSEGRHFRKCRRGRAGPAIAGGEVKNFHEPFILTLSEAKGKHLKMRRGAATGDPSQSARLRMTGGAGYTSPPM